MLGIDVSAHNGQIDWEKVKKDGIAFAILRMGFGSNVKSQDDRQIFQNIKECERLHIPYGLYLYSYALSEQDVQSEVQHMLRIADGHNPKMGLWYDMEDSDGYKEKHGLTPSENKEKLTGFCSTFLKGLKTVGYKKVGVYASYDYFKNSLDVNELRKSGDIWLADWRADWRTAKPPMDCLMWQCTSKGSVTGVDGNVDLDYYYGENSFISKIIDWLLELLKKIMKY